MAQLRQKGDALRRGGKSADNDLQVGLLPNKGSLGRNYRFIRRILLPQIFSKRAGETLRPDLATPGGPEFHVTWIGHASWLIQTEGVNVLVDPVWANWLGLAAGVGALAIWAVAGTDLATLVSRPGFGTFVAVCVVTGIGAAWVASVLWNMASRRLSPSLAGQLIVSETVFGLVYSFAWDGAWPAALQWAACALFVLGILASIKAHR